MKLPGELRTALSDADRLVGERRDLLVANDRLVDRITDAARHCAGTSHRAAEAEFGGDGKAIEQAQKAHTDADTAYQRVVNARKVGVHKLEDLVARSRASLENLEAEFIGYKTATLAELQAEFAKAVEDFATIARRLAAQADGLGLTAVPVARISSLPGITATVALSLDWSGDAAAQKAREQIAGPLTAIQALQSLPGDASNLRAIVYGDKTARPDFAAVAHHAVFLVLRTIRISGKNFEPGEMFPAHIVSPQLLAQLYNGYYLAPMDLGVAA